MGFIMLKGKNAIIIGATSAIGENIAIEFSKSCVDKMILHGRNQKHLTQIISKCSSFAVTCTSVVGTLSNHADIDRIKKEIIQNASFSVDIFVYCPGTCGDMDPISFLNIKGDIEPVLQINLMACVQLVYSLIHLFSQTSSCLFITSINSFQPLECGTGYCTTKSGLKSFMKSLALELGPKGIRVNSIAPGLVNTKFHDQYFDTQEELQDFMEEQISEHPLNHLPSLECIANSAKFLCSELAADITGTELIIDCGFSLTLSINPQSNDIIEEEDS